MLHKRFCNVADLVMNSSLVASSLNSALALSITAVDSSSASSSGGAQLTAYSLTTAAVNNDTVVLSGVLICVCCAVLHQAILWHVKLRYAARQTLLSSCCFCLL